jgi:predicted nucleotidyltransferase
VLAEPRFFDLLALLQEHEIEYILVGGVAAILHGAPVMTGDLDIVYCLEPENLERLAGALRAIGATYRDPAGRQIVPDTERLIRYRVNLLNSRLGPLDALQTIGDALDFTALTECAEWFEVEGLRIQVLNLETIIATKAHADRPKDRATLPLLRALLRARLSGDDL